MKIFITWSGEKSYRVAAILRDWLPKVVPFAEPWVSRDDLSKGSRWNPELWENLRSSEFGIACMVHGNTHEPWIVFEAGVLAGARAKDRVSPFLFGVAVEDLPGPLSQFQCTDCRKEDVRRLIRRINHANPAGAIQEEELDKAFNRQWRFLKQALDSIAASTPALPLEPDENGMDGIGDIEEPKLDSLDVEILKTLATMILDSQHLLGLQFQLRQPPHVIKAHLRKLISLGFVHTTSQDLDRAYLKALDPGIEHLEGTGEL